MIILTSTELVTIGAPVIVAVEVSVEVTAILLILVLGSADSVTSLEMTVAPLVLDTEVDVLMVVDVLMMVVL